MSYSMPQGETWKSEVDLIDFTYDGDQANGYLTGGLGQLVDSEEGLTNFRLDTGFGRGYEWVGWENSTGNQTPVSIVFEFDNVRNFTAVELHCNNIFSKEVRVFRQAKLYFSIGGEHYQETPVVFDYMKDSLLEFARYVIISMQHRVARYVKVNLYFDATWMMISEVTFDSGEMEQGVFRYLVDRLIRSQQKVCNVRNMCF